jgi:single-strand DNA-binding protein
MIKLQLIGNLGRDCVVNTVNGRNVINFSIAHTEKFKDNAGVQKERVIWVECAYWTDRTAVAPYLKKGTQVYAEGTPDIRTYQTNDGRQGASLTLRVQNVQLLGSRPANEGGSGEQAPVHTGFSPGQEGSSAASDISQPAVDDLPF